jgi:hypothetical protein
MADQINIKDPVETPLQESLPYRLGFIAAAWRRKSGRRQTAADVVRALVEREYKRMVKEQIEEAQE